MKWAEEELAQVAETDDLPDPYLKPMIGAPRPIGHCTRAAHEDDEWLT